MAKLKTAQVRNWTPTGRAAQNKKGGKRKGKGGRPKAKRKPNQSAAPKVITITKYRNRPAGGTKTGAVANKGKATRANKSKRNGSAGGGALSQFKLRGNPSLGEASSIGKIAMYGVGGGILARTNSAVGLAIVRRFGGEYGAQIADHSVARPIGTALSSWFLVPWELRKVGVRSEQSLKVAQVGGIVFAAADLLDVFTDAVDSLPDKIAGFVGGDNNAPVITNGNTDPENAAKQIAAATAQAAANAGLSPEQTANVTRSAVASTLGALEGGPSVDDISVEDYIWQV